MRFVRLLREDAVAAGAFVALVVLPLAMAAVYAACGIPVPAAALMGVVGAAGQAAIVVVAFYLGGYR